MTAELTDLDGGTTGIEWQWARGSSRTGRFTDIKGATNAEYSPGKDDVNKYLRATATYADGQGGGKSAHAVSNARTLHEASAEPRFLDDDGTELDATDNNAVTFTTTGLIRREIAENARQGANVGSPVTAVDIGDNGRPERLTYTLSGTDDAKFDIGRSNGQIRVKSGFTPDFEATSVADNCDGNDDHVCGSCYGDGPVRQ